MARPENPEVIYLDSSAIIAAVKAEHGSEALQDLLADVEAGRYTLIASAACLVEVRGTGRNEPVDPLIEKRVRSLLEGPKVILVELDRQVGLKAREFAQEFNLRTWDAVHLASAVVGGADVLMTLDVDDFPMDREVEGVWVRRPYALRGPNLFAG